MLNNLHYILCALIIAVGLYGVASNSNYIKKLVCLSIFQSGVIMFFLAIAKVHGGSANPLPHVLMLTAIVVGVATLAVGLALTVMIKKTYNTIEEDEI